MIQLYICIFSFLYSFSLWFTQDIEYSSLCYTIEPIVYPFPGGSDSKESACNAGDLGLIPGQGDPLRRQWQPTPVFLPGESQGWGSLVGCRLWGCTELDTTEAT